MNRTCQSQKGADVSALQPIAKCLNGPTDGRKDHYQVADSVPCLIRAEQTIKQHERNMKVRENLTAAAQLHTAQTNCKHSLKELQSWYK